MHRAVTLLLVLATVAGCTTPGPIQDADRFLDLPAGEEPGGIELLPPARPAGNLTVHVLDVGQGDATIWQLPGDGIVLYDCGGGRSSADDQPVTGYLEEQLGLAPGAPVDMLIVSHGHLDHLRACEEVLQRYDVATIVDLWYTGADRTQAYRAFQAAALAEDAELVTVADVPGRTTDRRVGAGDALRLPSGARQAGVQAQVLWPQGPIVQAWDGVAAGSLVVRLSHGPIDVCFQGDVSTEEEARMLALAPGIDCEGYLVGHHGSAHASSQAWLDQIDPEVAVVSFGDNPYGHPTSEALCRVQTAGAPVYATHRLGPVRLTSDGSGLRVDPDQPESQNHCLPGANYWDGAPPDRSPAPKHIDGELTVEAQVSEPEPCRFTDVTIHANVSGPGGTGVANATVHTIWRYKTSAPEETTTTGPDGTANVTRYISGASAAYTVEVEVQAWTADHGGQTTTAFTPRDC